MIKIDPVIKLLKSEGKLSFEKIWTKLKDSIVADVKGTKADETKVKNDLFLSLISSEKIITLGQGVWDLAENYSSTEIKKIQDKVLFDELDSDAVKAEEIEEKELTEEDEEEEE